MLPIRFIFPPKNKPANNENLLRQLTEKHRRGTLFLWRRCCLKGMHHVDALTRCFHTPICGGSDLSEAPRLIADHTKGIACILGNRDQIPAALRREKLVLMFFSTGEFCILGDEGSGAVLE